MSRNGDGRAGERLAQDPPWRRSKGDCRRDIENGGWHSTRVSSAPSTADEDGADRNGALLRDRERRAAKADIKDFCELKVLVNLAGKRAARTDR